MYDRPVTPQPFRFLGLGKIRLGLAFVVFVATGSFLVLLALSAASSHFAYASAKTVPIPPRRPDVMTASPAYIQQLMEREGYTNTAKNVYEDAFSYPDNGTALEEEEEYEENVLASLREVDSDVGDEVEIITDTEEKRDTPKKADIIADYGHRVTKSGIPVPGHKPAYGKHARVQRIEDFSDNPSSVKLAMVEPEAGGHYSDVYTPNDLIIEASSEAVRQPILEPGGNDQEKALVSFTLDPAQVSLDPNLKKFLLERAVTLFKNDPDVRLEIHAYASNENNQEYSDVRRALARALDVRSFLLEQNIEPSRLKITPMGQDADNATDDRIDLLFINSSKP